MSSSEANKKAFFELLEGSLADGTFRRGTLSKPVGTTPWKRVVITAYNDSEDTARIAFDYDDGRQVERKTASLAEAFRGIETLIPTQFATTHLKLASEEVQFEQSAQGSFRFKRRASSTPAAAIASHNREKNYLVSADSPFLVGVGIANKSGTIKHERYDKFRQINKFVEILSTLIPASVLNSQQGVSAIDFGSGKHYLTFALSEFLSRHSEGSVVTGIEQRSDLVAFGQEVASSLGFNALHFSESAIADSTVNSVDLVVALHACDTATDDAIAKAVQAQARYICLAPCCHKYVRRHFQPSPDLTPILRHGILLERFAEGLTDSLRVLALEALGYQTKLFEFVSLEHTAKNIMITAAKTGRRNSKSLEALQQLKEKFSLKDFYLDSVLGLTDTPTP